jgi:hypothetical protein
MFIQELVEKIVVVLVVGGLSFFIQAYVLNFLINCQMFTLSPKISMFKRKAFQEV